MSGYEWTFTLPPRGTFVRSNPSDPLDYYYKPLIGRFYVERLRMALRLLPAARMGRVLEIGFGSGILVPSLMRMANEYVGVDLDADVDTVRAGLAKLGVGQGVMLLRGDLRELDLPPFDLVVAMSIFEHVAPIEDLLDTVVAGMRPGGLLLVGMPRVDKGMTMLFKSIGLSNINDLHVTSYAQFKDAALAELRLEREAWMPGALPEALALYHGGLFRKKA